MKFNRSTTCYVFGSSLLESSVNCVQKGQIKKIIEEGGTAIQSDLF